MLDLIATTIGVLMFFGWSFAMVCVGVWGQRRREERQQRARIARLLADTKAAKVEPVRRVPSADVRARSHA